MSKQRKHIETEILTQFPEPTGEEKIAQVVEAKGRNLLEVEYSDGSRVLALIPAKYHKKVWIKNNNFIIVHPTVLPDATTKVLAIVRHPLLGSQDIQHLIDTNQWPPEFLPFVKETLNLVPNTKPTNQASTSYVDMDFMSDEDDEEWGHNPNHNELEEESSDEYD